MARPHGPADLPMVGRLCLLHDLRFLRLPHVTLIDVIANGKQRMLATREYLAGQAESALCHEIRSAYPLGML